MRWLPAVLAAAACGAAAAQTLYKYTNEDGVVVFSDRAPTNDVTTETRALPTGPAAGTVTVTRALGDGQLRLIGRNETHAPVQFSLIVDRLQNLSYTDPEPVLDWVIPPYGEQELLALIAGTGLPAPGIDYRYQWLPGDPAAEHRPPQPYRAPFAVAARYPVTQAWPDMFTHGKPDSRHAVDIAMPIGTDVHAARGGIVVDLETNQFRSGLDADIGDANLVRILHDDGTFGVYGHLNRSSIRVRAGDRVERGDYIADSGNTGFSSGPHLHFVVVRNAGFRLESVPVTFAGADGRAVTVATGDRLVAW